VATTRPVDYRHHQPGDIVDRVAQEPTVVIDHVGVELT
jgi:hypothetical protein